MNNRTRIAIVAILIFFILLAIDMVGDRYPREAPKDNIPEAPSPTPTIQVTTPQEKFSEIVCKKPDKDMSYGGIGGSENNPPTGTSIDQDLTKRYNMPVATGDCGTYWYIAGWWFSESEMARLPSESIMYKISPYALNGSGGGGVQEQQYPIAPIPEMPNTILIILGISMVMILKKCHR